MSWPWNFAEQLFLKCLWTAASVTSVFPFIKILLIITETYEAQEKIWLYPTTHYYHKLRRTYIDMKRVTYINMKRVTQKCEWVNLVVKKELYLSFRTLKIYYSHGRNISKKLIEYFSDAQHIVLVQFLTRELI